MLICASAMQKTPLTYIQTRTKMNPPHGVRLGLGIESITGPDRRHFGRGEASWTSSTFPRPVPGSKTEVTRLFFVNPEDIGVFGVLKVTGDTPAPTGRYRHILSVQGFELVVRSTGERTVWPLGQGYTVSLSPTVSVATTLCE